MCRRVTGNRNVKNIFQRELRNVSLHIVSHSPDEAYDFDFLLLRAPPSYPPFERNVNARNNSFIEISVSPGPLLSCKFNAQRRNDEKFISER